MPAEDPSAEAFELRLAALRARFAARLRADAAELAVLMGALSDAGDEEAALRRVRDLAHGLHGAAGAFGQPRIGEFAAKVESAAEAALADNAATGPEPIAVVQVALAQLRAGLGPELL